MKDTNNVVCMVVDSGLYVEFACVLARTYKKVYYCTPGAVMVPFPRLNMVRIGYGMEGLEVVASPFDIPVDEVDLYVFPDIHYGAMQLHLEGLGKAVWGSRMAEEIENDRVLLKQVTAGAGLAVGPYEVVTGMKALRKYLQRHPGVYVKVDGDARGNMESFHVPDYDLIRPKLDKYAAELGEYQDDVRFVVEERLEDKIELGIDSPCIDGKYPGWCIAGLEVKDECYVSRLQRWGDIPEPVTRWNTATWDIMQQYGYRGMISTEVQIGSDHDPYMLDLAARCGSPPSELYQEQIANLADVVWLGANGVLVDPVPARDPEDGQPAVFGVELFMLSAWAEHNFLDAKLPPELKPHVKFRNCTKVDEGHYCVIPQSVPLDSVCAVVAWRSTLQAALDEVNDIAEQVRGIELKYHPECLDEAVSRCGEAARLGLDVLRTDEVES